MKKYLFTFISLILINELNAQNYIPFPIGNVVWKDGLFSGMCMAWEFTVYDYHQQGDTVINGISYHKIYRSSYYQPCTMPPTGTQPIYSPPVYAFAIREENRHIYQAGIPETMLYNFDLQLGDTLEDKGYSPNLVSEKQYVAAIDSFLFANAYRKRYAIYPALQGSGTIPDTTYLIEGIGTSRGFIPSFSEYLDIGTSFMCIKFDGQGHHYGWNDPTFPYFGGINCDMTTSVELNNIQLKTINIYPNPMYFEAEIKLPQANSPYVIEIYDLNGNLILKRGNIYGNYLLTRNEIAEGFYEVRVYSINEKPIILKLVVL